MTDKTPDPCGSVSSTELGGGPVRVRLSRAKGWRMPPNTVKVDRASRYGNDFVMAHEGTRNEAIAAFERQAAAQMAACPDWYAPLRGKNLACWCPLDKPCHADVLLRLANHEPPNTKGNRTREGGTP